MAGEIDLAVHSAKDVPGELAEGCELVATPPRAAAHDVLVRPDPAATRPASTRCRSGARVGRRRCAAERSSSPRGRTSRSSSCAGNVDTRLRKLDAGEVDALVLAAAGLERLGRRSGPARRSTSCPRPGRGRWRSRSRADDRRTRDASSDVHDPRTHLRGSRAPSGPPCVYWKPVVTHLWESTRKTARFAGSSGCRTAPRWVADEVAGEDGEELARRMLAAGAGELLARARRCA